MPYSFQNQFTTPQYSNPAPQTAASRAMPQTYSAPSGGFGNQSVNTSATSRSVNPFGSAGIPDMSYADPNTLKRLDISNLIYSPTAGGYEYSNRNYSGLGNNFGGDANANRAAGDYYNYIGSLPTIQKGSPALNLLNQSSGYRPPPGPSYNQQLGSLFNNSNSAFQGQLQNAGFTPQYQGPYAFGRSRNIGVNLNSRAIGLYPGY